MAEFGGKPVAQGKKIVNHHHHHQIITLPSTKPFPKRVKGKKMMITKSITKLEIERYWKNKHMEEEDHLFAAIKAAARIRARNLTEEVYKRFEESIKERLQDDDGDEYSEESGVGIKDWWTKSKYAYLNQPAVGTPDKKKKAHSYTPNSCFYKTPASSPGLVVAAAYLGVY